MSWNDLNETLISWGFQSDMNPHDMINAYMSMTEITSQAQFTEIYEAAYNISN